MSDNEEQPTVGEQVVPLWIKVMWLLGIIWVISYIYLGLQSSPESW